MKEYAAESHDACIAAENIHRLDPAKFPAIHSLERPPFFAKPQVAPDATTGGMPYGNALFAFLWFHAFIKHVNMGPYLCPSADTPLDVLFERKVPNPDGTPSDEYVINHHLVAKLCFTVACCLSASATYRQEKKNYFRVQVATLIAAENAGRMWREQLRDCLKKWEPEFAALIKKKRRVAVEEDNTAVSLEMQVDPGMI